MDYRISLSQDVSSLHPAFWILDFLSKLPQYYKLLSYNKFLIYMYVYIWYNINT